MVSSASPMDPTRVVYFNRARGLVASRPLELHWQLALMRRGSPPKTIGITSQKFSSQHHLTFLSLLFLNNKYNKKFNGNTITALIIPITTSSKEYPLNPMYKSTCPSGATPNHVAFTAIQLNTRVTTHVARCTRVNLH